MAVHRPTEEACGRCRSTPAFETTRFSSGLRRDPGALDVVCIDCYLDGLERAGLQPLRWHVGIEVEGGTVHAAAATEDGARSLRDALESGPLGAVSRDVTLRSIPAAFDSGDGDRAYLRELARGLDSEVRAIYRGSTPSSAVDVTSHVDDSRRLDDALAAALRRHLDDVETRDDLRSLLRTERSPYPALARHGVLRRVEGRLWRHLRRTGSLSNRSLTSGDNQRSGREFEAYFEKVCESRGLTPRRPAADALESLYPEVHASLVDRFSPGLPGVPDYFVEVDGHRSFDSGWRPTEDCFVEVKRGSSRLSRRQARVAAHLKSHGFPVYVLRGEPGDHRFDRR
ncbi:MAG: hypothetical protein ACLFMT_00055 [Halobacteriales archaeon]